MTSLILSPFNREHERAMVLPPNEHGDQRYFFSDNNPPPRLTEEAKAWADHNTPGYEAIIGARGTTFLIEMIFKNDRDAVLFKLFWL